MNQTVKTGICLALLYLFWGFNWAVMRVAGNYFTPALYVVFRFAIGAIILLAVCAYRKKLVPPRQYWKWIAITGVLIMAGNNLIIQICTTQLGAGLAAVVNYTQSAFVCILAVFFLSEPFTLRKALGIVLSAAGLLILMNVDTSGPMWAILLDLCGAALWGTSNVIIKARLAGCDMIQYTAWQMVCGAIVLIAYNLFHPPQLVIWTPLSVLTALYGSILASALGFLLFNYLLTHMEAGRASIAVMAVPAVGVISGIIVFREPMTLKIAIGMLILLGGIFLVLWNKQRQAAPKK